MNVASMSATKQFVSGETALARCLPWRSIKIRSVGCSGTLIDDDTFLLIRSIAK